MSNVTPAQRKKAGDLAGAITQLQQMLAAGEDCVFQLAKYLQAAGRYPEAIELLDKAKAGAAAYAKRDVAGRQNDPDEAAARIFARRNFEIAKAGLLIAQRQKDEKRVTAYELDLAAWGQAADQASVVLRTKRKERLAEHHDQMQAMRLRAATKRRVRWFQRGMFGLLVVAVVASIIASE